MELNLIIKINSESPYPASYIKQIYCIGNHLMNCII